ncbi:MAG: hypothetical protein C4336_07230 [Armatimonadota bacterium]
MQKGVDAVAIGVIVLGLVVLIVLLVVSNNMMPDPIPAPTMPDLNATAQKIENPIQSGLANMGAGGAQPSTFGGSGFGAAAPPAAPPPPSGGLGGGRRGSMPDDY